MLVSFINCPQSKNRLPRSFKTHKKSKKSKEVLNADENKYLDGLLSKSFDV